ncbi:MULTISPECIES: hypothetical protein [unclassified Cryobacterium]|uniref:hypothetical protein n=1 Tax=unclassified Cryobacterium TaxID=2649013 RepID=UPI002AB38729|nr:MULTISPECIES: hypothetical protein [unclassified Cryobacterium]MDY7528149.1 hypothetical protein [Cryobacterium sp. 10C2]MDY7556102.1 hypothetical protein [Cryobacterium sp. 10C3]MEB0289352.1 hypothetical protein [Cryobacterium sp. 10C2]
MYEEITRLAKQLGGVDNLIKNIETGAVTKAAPKLMAAGALGAGVVYAGVRGVVKGGKFLARKYKAHQVAASDAKNQLKAKFEEASKPDENMANGVAPSNDDGEATRA